MVFINKCRKYQATFSLLLKNVGHLVRGTLPGQLVIQYTDRCNARCPQCGMRVTESYPRSRLDMIEIKRTIDAAVRRGFQSLSFTGGEPLLFFDDIITLLSYARDAGIPFTRTGTNGFLFRGSDDPVFQDRIARIADDLRETGLYSFWISIDSADPAVHEDMRGLKGVIRGIEKALPIFHDRGIYPSINLGINWNVGGLKRPPGDDGDAFYKYFRDAFDRYFAFAVNCGFTIANCCYPMSVKDDGGGLSPVYRASSPEDIVAFTDEEKVLLYKALLDCIPRYRDRIRIFSPLSSLYAMTRQHSGGYGYCQPCRGGQDFFFINAADGNTYPCGYRGNDNLGEFSRIDFDRINRSVECFQCDWECFRDPSDFLGTLGDIARKPLKTARRVINDPVYAGLWLRDMRYYAACDFFSGRVAPDYDRLGVFREQ